MSPTRRRQAITYVRKHLDVSERCACGALDQPRSTQRYRVKVKPDEALLLQRIEALVRRYPRFGYRRIHALLRREGWPVNRKRVHRLWQVKGYKPEFRLRKVKSSLQPKRELSQQSHGQGGH